MKQNEIKKVFEKTFNNNKNVMTPIVLEFGEIKNKKLIYELSKGKGIFSPEMFGVTILKEDGDKTTLSNCFQTKEEAYKFIEELGQ